MADHLMIVLSNARPGMEDEFNQWYSKVHIVDIVDQLDGIDAAQPFVLSGVHGSDDARYRHPALYWIPEAKLSHAQTAIAWQRVERAEALAAGRDPVIPKRDVFAGDTQGLVLLEGARKHRLTDSVRVARVTWG